MKSAAPETILNWLSALAEEEGNEAEPIQRLEPAEFYDKHIVGVAYRCDLGPVLAYNLRGILTAHIEQDGMSVEEAEDYFEQNTLGSWVGEGTPLFVDTGLPDMDLSDASV
tara:strand:- start:343 stop:675 length:333 start_codon:yes stop_codon:yes gene_type:complete